MADNVAITAGSGTDVATDDVGGVHFQRIKLVDGTLDSTAAIAGDATYGLDVDVTRLPAVTIAAAQTLADVTTLGTITNVVHVDDNSGSLTIDGAVGVSSVPADPFGANADAASATGSLSAKLRFIAETGIPITGSVTVGAHAVTNAGTFAVQVDGTALTRLTDIETNTDSNAVVGNGTAATAQRVTLANDSTGVVGLATGANAIGKLTANAGVTIGAVEIAAAQTLATVTNLSQLGGQAVAMGTGVRSAGTQRVTIATDDVVPASQSGTWTVQPGNTANTTPWLVAEATRTTGGLTTYHLASAASTNATVVKNAAGQLYGWYIYNSNASARKLAFHNSSSAPTAGASIFFTLVIPALSGANVFLPHGIAFSAGIAITTVTGLADNDTAAVAVNDLIINLWYA